MVFSVFLLYSGDKRWRWGWRSSLPPTPGALPRTRTSLWSSPQASPSLYTHPELYICWRSGLGTFRRDPPKLSPGQRYFSKIEISLRQKFRGDSILASGTTCDQTPKICLDPTSQRSTKSQTRVKWGGGGQLSQVQGGLWGP